MTQEEKGEGERERGSERQRHPENTRSCDPKVSFKDHRSIPTRWIRWGRVHLPVFVVLNHDLAKMVFTRVESDHRTTASSLLFD